MPFRFKLGEFVVECDTPDEVISLQGCIEHQMTRKYVSSVPVNDQIVLSAPRVEVVKVAEKEKVPHRKRREKKLEPGEHRATSLKEQLAIKRTEAVLEIIVTHGEIHRARLFEKLPEFTRAVLDRSVLVLKRQKLITTAGPGFYKPVSSNGSERSVDAEHEHPSN